MTYRTHPDGAGELLDEHTVSYTWHLISESGLSDEVAAHGLEITRAGAGELVIYTVTGGAGGQVIAFGCAVCHAWAS